VADAPLQKPFRLSAAPSLLSPRRACRKPRLPDADRPASAKVAETRDQVARIARFTATAIGLERDLRDDETVLDDRYHAGIYGIPDASTLAAMRLVAGLEAMITDPVYEGKSMAGLIDLVTRGEIERESNVLYAHLGGQPAINAYASLLS
jgi:1-aminocyclopropane-1-carboxylate deaminase